MFSYKISDLIVQPHCSIAPTLTHISFLDGIDFSRSTRGSHVDDAVSTVGIKKVKHFFPMIPFLIHQRSSVCTSAPTAGHQIRCCQSELQFKDVMKRFS